MIKVLVVDDSALLRKVVGQVLAQEKDFEVAFARNGREAMEIIPDFNPHVVTLDIHMPEMDGLTCLDRIMIEHPRPVIMLSSVTAAGANETLEALRLGAFDFVPKPTGAVSLRIADMAPALVAKVRAAAIAKLRPSLRLRERVRHRISGTQISNQARQRRAAAGKTGTGLVLVGCSTGGPPALEALLPALPASFPWPILVAQHMPRAFTGSLARRLDEICRLKVLEVDQQMALEPGCAYIARGDADLIVIRRASTLFAATAASEPDYLWHPSTDRLVRTALNHIAPDQLVGVLLTGMGNDGATAMAQMRSEGGRTIAESEDTAVVWGMPGELVKIGGADHVLPLDAIAKQLLKLVC